MMDSGDLRVFEAVTRLGSMSRAAVSLNTVQSNVTARIKAMEAKIGVPLFERHGRGVSMTEAGKRLLPYAQRIIDLLSEAERVAKDDGSPSGNVTLGSLDTAAALRLAPVLSRYVAAFPDVELTLRTGTTRDLLQLVRDGEVEGAFVCGPVDLPDLEAEEVFTEELVVLGANGIKSLSEALHDPGIRIVVLKAGCSYRQRLEEIMVRRGVASPRVLEFGTLEAVFGCVAAGLGITMLPVGLLDRIWKSDRVSVHRLPRSEAWVSTVFVRRRDRRVSSAVKAFLDEARTEFRNDVGALAAIAPLG